MIINNVISHPHPHCLVPIERNPDAYAPSYETDISRRFARVRNRPVGDDYDLVNRQDWLDKGFKQ